MALHLAVVEDHEAPPEVEEPPARFEVLRVPRTALMDVWAHALPIVVADFESEGVSTDHIENILAELMDGVTELWVVIEGKRHVGVACSRIEDRYRGRRMHVWAFGENMMAWGPEMFPALEAYARERGCTFMEASGRRGWRRMLGQFGAKPVATVYRKDL